MYRGEDDIIAAVVIVVIVILLLVIMITIIATFRWINKDQTRSGRPIKRWNGAEYKPQHGLPPDL